ncbi:hypothetical protein EDD36DRAFT_417552 [Exophiala viscosa]|uniref:DUF4219 domain-containing protein n=1 Tax=Exophiala viscosa TaxID=2486360 RepID=A0AAN6DWU0_9EURO|nr:hypothetical protein EDD36DRAFT_417552 [Exophiala viscosa]
MSDLTPDPEAGFERLVGKSNYARWARGFQTIAKLKGVWSLVSGKEKVLEESYLYGHHSKEYFDLNCTKCFERNQTYTAQNVRVQTAQGLLEFWVNPDIRYEIKSEQCPSDASWHLEEVYKMEDEDAIRLAYEALNGLHLKDFKNMSEYLKEHRLVRADLLDANAIVTPGELIDNIMGGLNGTYLDRVPASRLQGLEHITSLGVLADELLELERVYAKL